MTQIKRHRRGEAEGRQKGSLTHGKKTPGIEVNEHEPRDERTDIAEVAGAATLAEKAAVQENCPLFRALEKPSLPYFSFSSADRAA